MFNGFSHETYEFFMAIAFNNNMSFFHDNHDWYLRAVRQPCLDLADALGSAMEKIDDEIERRPNRVVSRINRDIRFSRDKSPYRDHLWLSFQRPDEEHGRTPGFWFEIDANGASWGLGSYAMHPRDLQAFRAVLLQSPEKILLAFTPALERFSLTGGQYKRIYVPPGFSKELLPLWSMRNLIFERTSTDFSLLNSPMLVDELIRDFNTLAPAYFLLQQFKTEGSRASDQ